MRAEKNQVRVALAERSYNITIGYGILEDCLAELKELSKVPEVYIISDSNVYPLYGKQLEDLLHNAGYKSHCYIIPAREEAKSWAQAALILDDLIEKNLERKTPVLALGGGVVGDLAGFVAALYRRGMPFIQVPTTLLAQVDSSVGGKVAVNHPRGKNMFGTFYQPAAVWAELTTLETLSQEEWRAGLAEVAKYAVIKDAGLFRHLEEHGREILDRDRRFLPGVIADCCRIKAEIVSLDERDEGLRNILNFGHTFGHALESATNYKEYRHGEAVAIGMAAVLELAVLLQLISREECRRVLNLLKLWQLPVHIPAHLVDKVLEKLVYDKKVSNGQVTFVLPTAIGQVIMRGGLAPELLRMSLLNIAE